ncbi:CGNR zinc finger domain-containing protein [Nocardia sp. NPDC003482]|uniref:CGNR zinc finger domain-containing protein n=1 Tax=Nocardia sp. NPDC004068 TaxID=3364303 RepID=UPI003673C8C3
MVPDDHERSGAPGDLEEVRTLLNSWNVPNDTRIPRDQLSEWSADERVWNDLFHTVPRPRRPAEVDRLARARDIVRALVDGNPDPFEAMIADEHRPAIRIAEGRLAFDADSSAVGRVVSIVLAAAAEGTLGRLRACGDCAWVFYDSSRNNRRRWCAMIPSPGVRGCGSAAKAREYRSRHRPGAVIEA